MKEPTTARVEWEYAAFGDRLCADLADGVIWFVMALPVYLLVDRQLLGLETGLLDDGTDYGISDLVFLFWFLFNMTYLVGQRGQSWGRQFWGLKVVNSAGEPVGFFRALFRNLFAMFVSALPLTNIASPTKGSPTPLCRILLAAPWTVPLAGLDEDWGRQEGRGP